MKFDPVEMCAVLDEEGVDFVVLGGFAAVVQGSPLPTEDLDVIPERSSGNLDRLAVALRRLGATIRTGDEAIATKIDGPFLANMPHMLNLRTDFGDIDLVYTPAGELNGYAEWAERAQPTRLRDGLIVAVAHLDDIIASKVAANRPKDQRALPYLESLRDQLKR